MEFALRPPILPLALCASLALTACGHARSHPSEAAAPVAAGVSLHEGGLAILTPTASSGQDEDRQAVASQLSDSLTRLRPDLRVVPLTQTLSAVNAAGLAPTYDHLYSTYKNTGLLDGQDLTKIAQTLGVRYVIQLKIAAYDQSSGGGVGFLLAALIRDKKANVRLFLQVWDSQTGRVVWEKTGEETEKKWSLVVERSIDMQEVVKSELDKLVPEIPG